MFTPLQTDRLILRRLTADDAPVVHSYRSDPEVFKYQMWRPRSLDETRDFLAQLAVVVPNTPGTWLQLGIVIREDNTLIGDCGIRFPDNDPQQVEVGITLSRLQQRKGFATEALSAVLTYVFETLHKHRVFTSIDPRNVASISLVSRIGMRQEAHLRESILFNGEWLDDVIYAMLEREWAEQEAER